MQLDEPVVDSKYPTPQLMQRMALKVEYVPTEQLMQIEAEELD